ncbi:MAG: class IV adenylate cyclase [Zestosphaera sp.]
MAFISVREYEVKVRVEDLNAVERKLISAGWRLEDFLDEEDRYVSLTHCAGNPARQIALRLRLRKSLISNEISSELTFKGRVTEEGIKAREELTAPLVDPDTVTKILILSGFPIITVSKRRRIYSREGCNVKVYLDEVFGLGSFVEVEVINPASRSDYVSALNEVKELLDLSREENIVKSYLELSLEARRK